MNRNKSPRPKVQRPRLRAAHRSTLFAFRLFLLLATFSLILFSSGCTGKIDDSRIMEEILRKYPDALPHQAPKGRPMPQLTFTTLDGKTFGSDDLKGKPTILNFMASWCTACAREVKDLNTLYSGLKGKANIYFVSLDYLNKSAGKTPNELAQEFVEKWGLEVPMVVGTQETDEKFGRIFYLPTLFLFDSKGVVRLKEEGLSAEPDGRLATYYTELVEDLLKEERDASEKGEEIKVKVSPLEEQL